MITYLTYNLAGSQVLPEHAGDPGGLQERRPLHAQRRAVPQLLQGEEPSRQVRWLENLILLTD